METAQIVWLCLMVLFVILEAVTTALVSIWFCAGALVALLISLFAPGLVPLQAGAFLAVSAACLFALRPMARKLVGSKKTATNADANIGKTARVVESINPPRFGRVKVDGLEWLARAEVALPVGSICRVQAIEGAKLVVAPAEEAAQTT